MREIKFRVWQNDRKIKRMIYPKDLCDYAVLQFSGQPNNSMRPSFFCNYHSYIPPIIFVIMQYTGLKDKDSKDIYEGDILRHNLWGISQIIWGHGMFRGISSNHDVTLADHQLQRSRVIGNIYENPELLKE